jgi:hypothetical protein
MNMIVYDARQYRGSYVLEAERRQLRDREVERQEEKLSNCPRQSSAVFFTPVPVILDA